MRYEHIILLFGVAGRHSGSVIVASAMTPRPGAFWGGMNDNYQRDGDVPIVGDKRRRRKRGIIIRRRRSKVSPEDPDSDTDASPPFFYDQEDNIDWRDQYELDKMRRRWHRDNNNNKRNNAAEYGIPSPWESLRQWTISRTGVRIPQINFHFDPITILKIRKSWNNVIPGVIVRVGADFETHYRVGGGLWKLRACLEDKFLGGRFTMKRKRDGGKGVIMEYTKSWLFAGTGTGSFATRFNLCSQYDLQSNRGSFRFGFRTESMGSVGSIISSSNMVQGMNRRQGFTIIPVIPLDGADGHFKLEAKTSVELPEPEITVGMTLGGVSVEGNTVGMGIGCDVDVDIDELNVICLF